VEAFRNEISMLIKENVESSFTPSSMIVHKENSHLGSRKQALIK
jgi:hypothetical protein